MALPGTGLSPLPDTVPLCRLQTSWWPRLGCHDHHEVITKGPARSKHRRAVELTSDVLHLADGQAPLGAVDGLFIFGGGLQEDHVCISQQDSSIRPAVQDVGHLLALQRGVVGVVHMAGESTHLDVQQVKLQHAHGTCAMDSAASAGPEASHAEAWPTPFMIEAVEELEAHSPPWLGTWWPGRSATQQPCSASGCGPAGAWHPPAAAGQDIGVCQKLTSRRSLSPLVLA